MQINVQDTDINEKKKTEEARRSKSDNTNIFTC